MVSPSTLLHVIIHSSVYPVEQQRQPHDVIRETPAPRPPIYGPVPQSPAHTSVDQYASYLRSVYTSKKLPTYGKWPPTASKKYIHLAVVKKEKVSKQQADAFTKATLHGNIDDICKKKQEVGFSEVGKKEDGSPAKLILVEGAPGIGKTTFAWKVCRKWAKGKILNEYGLVVLLRLRDKRVREVKCATDLFYHDDHELQKSVAKEILHHQGKSVLLLYEGYDELPKRLRIQQSIFLDILRKDSLPNATILITSRPSATNYLHWEFREQISQHIEILGFARADIISYVQHVITDEKVYRDFLQYLEYYPYIRGMMYVPLNAVIVTEVYKSSRQSPEQFIPTTMTELYTALTRSLLLRYLLSHSEYQHQEWNLKNFSDLPKELHEQFCHICEVALKGMIEDEFVFENLPNDFNTLDLMQSVPELYVEHGTVVSYNFFHLTLQEYLAAVKISKLSVEKQIHFFEGNSGSEEVTETDSFNMDLQMMIGRQQRMKMDTTRPKQEPCLPAVLPHPQLSPLTTGLRRDHEMIDTAYFGKHAQAHSEDYKRDLETAVDTVNSKVMGISTTSIVSDTASLDYSNIHLPQPQPQHDLSKVPAHSQLMQSPPHLPHTSLDSLHPPPPSHHITSLGTELDDTTSAGFQKVLRFVAGLTKYENIPLDSLQQLLLQQDREDVVNISLNSLHWLFEARCISIYSDLIRNVSILQYSSSYTTMTPFDCFVLGYALSHISCTGDWDITMNSCHVDDECVEMLVNGINLLPSKKVQDLNITKLFLFNNAITAGGATALAEMLKENTTLQQLEVSGNSIGQGGATALAEMLKENTTLQQLNVSINSIGQGGATALAEMLKENTTLQQLNVSINSIGQGGATALAEMLKENTTLQQLSVSINFIGQGGATALAEMLKENTTLQQLDVSHNSIGQGGATALAEMLKENTTLQQLDVSHNSIGQGGATALAEMLKENTTLQQLDVSGNSIGQGGATALAEMLKENTTLQQLDVSFNSIGQGGATALAEMLKENTTLQQLDVSYTSIGQGGATALAEMLKENTTLQQLDVSYTSIGQGGATALAEMLKENTTLQQLDVRNTSIGQRETATLAEMHKENTICRVINY